MTMNILIKTDNKSKTEILNILYGDFNLYINEYINNEINCLKVFNIEKNIKDISYEIECENINSSIIYKLNERKCFVQKGYIFNSNYVKFVTIFEIKIIESKLLPHFIDTAINNEKDNLNMEINNIILRDLDKESLYKISQKFQRIINTKDKWLKSELLVLKTQIVNEYKKNLTFPIKKNKNKKKKLYGLLNEPLISKDTLEDKSKIFNPLIKNNILEDKSKIFNPLIKDNILEDKSKIFNSCRLDYVILNKEHYD
jgi:hypothetical protein